MSKIRSDYDQTLDGRFLKWIENGSDALEKSMTDAMESGADHHHENARQALEEMTRAEIEREERAIKVRENEQLAFTRVHAWARKNGSKLVLRTYYVLAVLLCLAVIGGLISVVAAMPTFGSPDAPYNNEVSQRYIEKGLQETGAVNIVSGMILDYRAFDTFGESNVLFVAACSVLILLRIDRDKKGRPTLEAIAAEENDRIYEPKNDVILQRVASLLVPVIFIYGIYVVLNGHISPGGGFSGGAIIGAGLILYLNAFGFAKTERFFTYKTFSLVSFFSLLTYGCLKAYSFFCGANHIESHIPLGTPGAILSAGFILPLDICVGCVVACTMYTFYTMFRKGGM